MIKRLLSITALLLFGLSASTVAQVNIGYMNTQEVMAQLPGRDQVEEELAAFVQERQTQLREKATAFQEAVADYQANMESMSDTEVQETEASLQELNTELSEFNQSIRAEIQQKRSELLSPLLERVDEAIATIAEQKDLDFVLNRSTNSGNTIVFYASQNQVDISDEVISWLNSNAPASN